MAYYQQDAYQRVPGDWPEGRNSARQPSDQELRLNIGDRVIVTIERLGPWGAYVRAATGELGFIDCIEFAWIKPSTERYSVGQDIEVLTLRVQPPPEGHTTEFLASIRGLVPDRNPWSTARGYEKGQRHRATVRTSEDGFTSVDLDTGVYTRVSELSIAQEGRPERGDRVVVEIEALDWLRETMTVGLIAILTP